ncbi:unnamed protein product [Somion occarium]|uniref:Uncharacterized protein n=1 Tax=Somion occarium TaxID=3059160 RepID=A0ABP1CRN1_9APHY
MLDPDTTNTVSTMKLTTKDMLDQPPSFQTTVSGSSAASTPGFPGAHHEDPEEKAGVGNVDSGETARRASQSV